MNEHELPTWNDIVARALAELDRSRDGLAEASSWLRSDWRPLGTSLPPGAGDARSQVFDLIGEAKARIDQAKGLLYEARNSTGSR